MVFNDHGIAELRKQELPVERIDKYKYLGVYNNEGMNTSINTQNA